MENERTEMKLELRLEQILEQAQELEFNELKKLEGKRIIFNTITERNVVLGTLRGIGDNYLFFESLKLLHGGNNISTYINQRDKVYDKSNIKAEKQYGVYNKRDIGEMYKFDE